MNVIVVIVIIDIINFRVSRQLCPVDHRLKSFAKVFRLGLVTLHLLSRREAVVSKQLLSCTTQSCVMSVKSIKFMKLTNSHRPYPSCVCLIVVSKLNTVEDIGNFANFVVDDVPIDGNCMFTAICLQLRRNKEDFDAVRKEIVTYMKQNPVRKLLVDNQLVTLKFVNLQNPDNLNE